MNILYFCLSFKMFYLFVKIISIFVMIPCTKKTNTVIFHRVYLNSPVFSGVCVAQSSVFCVVFCRSLVILLSVCGHCVVYPSVCLWPLCCLSFFDLRLLIVRWYLQSFLSIFVIISFDNKIKQQKQTLVHCWYQVLFVSRYHIVF